MFGDDWEWGRGEGFDKSGGNSNCCREECGCDGDCEE
jgi:hypothetical protein